MQCHFPHLGSCISLTWKMLSCLVIFLAIFLAFFYNCRLPPFSLPKLSFVPFLLPALDSLCIPLAFIPPLLISELLYYRSIPDLTFAPLVFRLAAASCILLGR